LYLLYTEEKQVLQLLEDLVENPTQDETVFRIYMLLKYRN